MYVFHKLPEIEDLKRDRFLIRYWEIRSDRLWQSTRLSSIHSAIASKQASKNKDSDRLSEKLKILIMEIFLVLNGMEIDASIEEQERAVLLLAASDLGRE